MYDRCDYNSSFALRAVELKSRFIMAQLSHVTYTILLRPKFFYFLFYRFFSQQVRVGGRNKNKNKIHSDHFPIELKSKETQFCVSFDFNSIVKWSE